jgi:WD40 repeat protein
MKFPARIVRRLIGPWGRRSVGVLLIAGLWAGWAVVSAEPIAAWPCPSGPHDYFTLTPDGQTILHWNREPNWGAQNPFIMSVGPTRVCDAATGRERFKLEFVTSEHYRPEISPDGSWAAVQGEIGNHDTRLFDLADGHELARFTGERYAPHVRVNPDGRELAVNVGKGDVTLWDVATRRERVVLRGARWVLGYSPDGRRLATVSWDPAEHWPDDGTKQTVTVWDVATGQPVGRHDLPLVSALEYHLSPDGRWAAGLWRYWARGRSGWNDLPGFEPPDSYSVPDQEGLWDLATGAALAKHPANSKAGYGGVGFSPDGRWVVVRTENGPRYWDLRRSPPAERAPPEPASAHAGTSVPHFLPPTDRMIVDGAAPATLEVWSTADMSRQAVCRLRADVPPQLAASADGSLVATLQGDDTSFIHRVKLFLNKHIGYPKLMWGAFGQVFDTRTGAERATFGVDGNSRLLGFSPDGRVLWTSSFVGDPTPNDRGTAAIRGWATAAGPSGWLIAGTSVIILLIVADWWRGRRAVAR